MTGNEILLNMTNFTHFRESELVSSFNELSKRAALRVNKDVGKHSIIS